MTYFYQLLISLASGAVAAWLATFLALRRFYNEKWWEKKSSAFIELTNAVYQKIIFLDYLEELYDFRREPPENTPNFIELSEAELDKLKLASSNADAVIRKYQKIGPLLITESVTDLLSEFLKQERKVDYSCHYQGLDAHEGEAHLRLLAKKLLDDLLEESRKELKSK